MIDLPRVTLFVLNGGPGTALFKHAAEKTLQRINPKEFLVFTSKPEVWLSDTRFLDATVVRIPPCYSAKQAMHVYWYQVPVHVRTDYMMHVEWDGWVVDEGAWTNKFLDYDYIGAPWPWYEDDFQVGNGLGLRSKALMQHLADWPGKYPLPAREDHTLSREYRRALEADGFKWAPLDLARRFSWERGAKPAEPTFMFHGAFNFPHVLSREEFAQVTDLADDYVRGHVSWSELRTGGFL